MVMVAGEITQAKLDYDKGELQQLPINEGHPDKLCDQVSGAILEACLVVDPLSNVACETGAEDNMVTVAGEITTHAKLDWKFCATRSRAPFWRLA